MKDKNGNPLRAFETEGYKYEQGVYCFCNTSRCNGQEKKQPSLSLSFIIAVLTTVSLSRENVWDSVNGATNNFNARSYACKAYFTDWYTFAIVCILDCTTTVRRLSQYIGRWLPIDSWKSEVFTEHCLLNSIDPVCLARSKFRRGKKIDRERLIISETDGLC